MSTPRFPSAGQRPHEPIDSAIALSGNAAAGFEAPISRWSLVPDGAPIVTAAARLLPVRRHGRPAMLKIATVEEERRGAGLMAWWGGRGAAQVLAHEGDALLLERAEGARSLAAMARAGEDDAAMRILSDVAAALHAPRPGTPPVLVPLPVRFRALAPAAAAQGGILARAAATAEGLLAAPREIAVLHGDLHHFNALDFGARGWLAIDPKGLLGERGFDYANLFCNPDLGGRVPAVATRPERFARRLEVVAARAGLERTRLVAWILAWAGLSAAWSIGDGGDPSISLRVAQLAAASA
jgi:streptomycin 6-kinase